MNVKKIKTNKSRWFVAALAGTQILALNAAADDTSDAIADLKKQIQTLNQKVNDLETRQKATAEQQQKQKAEAEQQPQKAAAEQPAQKSASFLTAGWDGFTLQSADTNFLLKLHGFGQVDSHYYASAAPAKDTFTIRRLRAIASGSIYHDYDYFVQTDFASGITSSTTNNAFLTDAYLRIHYFPEFQVQAGKFKEPVSLEISPQDNYLWFLERGLPSELAP